MSTITSLEKGLRILQELAASEHGITAAELALATGLNRTTVYRLCDVLQRGDWVQRLDDEGEATRLDLGPAFHGIAILVTNKYETDTQLLPILAKLSRSLSETVHLGVREQDQIIHVAREMPDTGIHVAAQLGSRTYAHASGLGKALLATLSDAEVRSLYIGEALPVLTPNSISTVSALIKELKQIRESGYALDDQESRVGVKCVAVPVFGISGKAPFAISVTTLPQRLDGDSFNQVAEAIIDAGHLATTSLGGVAPEYWHRPLPVS